MNKFVLALAVTGILSVGAFADGMKVDSKDGKGGGDFTGTITAVEQTRDSFTVINDEGKVKMFSVPADKKSGLSVGQNVTVSYTDAYHWPLHTSNITVLSK